ncbi:MAG: hypothetical protein ABGX25_05990 [Nautiliaceae bacterium]
MLINTLQETINVLNKLIEITNEDLKNIKEANHEEVFKNIKTKEQLAYKFNQLKKNIDQILVQRNRPIEEIFNKEEENLFNLFREKLNIFYEQHKKFSKMAISVANFYNALNSQIKNQEQISYNERANFNSQLQIRA